MKPDDDLISDWSEHERAILSTAELDRPAHDAADRTLARLGLGLGLGAGVATVATAGKAAAVGVARGSLWLKLAGVALVGGGVAGAVAVKERTLREPAHAVVARPAVAVRRAPAAPSSVASANEAPADEAAPSVEGTSEPAASARSPAAANDRNGDAFATEVRLIDEARRRLRADDPRGALASLQRYSELVGHGGSLRAEATVVRIQALSASGEHQAASALARGFLSRNPKSAYADYVRALIGGPK